MGSALVRSSSLDKVTGGEIRRLELLPCSGVDDVRAQQVSRARGGGMAVAGRAG
jgi:hypothetical protein